MTIRQTIKAASWVSLALALLTLTACDRSESETDEAQTTEASTQQEGATGESKSSEASDEAASGHEHASADEGMEGHGTDNSDMNAHHGHEDMEHTLAEGEYEASDVVRQPGAEVGDISQCPVSGEVFRVTEDHTYFDIEDGRVYFCCPNCIRRFQRDPERWLSTQDVAVEE
jgi:YHS domain-containing protein